MANHKRRRPRGKPSAGYSANGLKNRLDGKVPSGDRRHWTGSYPKFWDVIHHSRPARRVTRVMEGRVISGADPDDMTWPDGRKPHVYFW